ncbi:MAG: hypothetical protein JNK77_13070 [Saprospiraceae bacterium]|nr:hypothetical protein [Saprospiraceae bacterium]
MLTLSRHIQSWLFIACMLFQGVAFPLLNDEFINLMAYVVETEHENDNGKESKAEIDKIFTKGRAFRLEELASSGRLIIDRQVFWATQFFLPVVTPPPKVFV